MLYNEVSSSVERLLIKQQQKNISPEELAELDQLLKEHPEARAYADFYHNDPFLELKPQDEAAVAAIWEDLEARMLRSRRKVVPLKKLLSAAAIILIISTTAYFVFKPSPKKEVITASVNNTNIILRVAGGAAVNLTGNDQTITTGNTSVIAGAKQMDLQGTNGAAQGWNTIEIPQRLDYKLKLADGSEVTLNSSSKLKFPFAFTTDKREVFIEGEAYFKIAKDTRHPFIVHTGKGDITVLGTEFNVNTYTANVLKTALVHGAVNVTSDKEVLVLNPGQELTLNGSKHTLYELDERNTLSWMEGIQYFHNTPLSEIAAMIERWYGVPVKIEDSKLAAEPFTGIMDKAQSLDEFLTPMKGVVTCAAIIKAMYYTWPDNQRLCFKLVYTRTTIAKMTTRSYLLAGTLFLLSSCYTKAPDQRQLIKLKGTYSMQTVLRKIEDQTGKRFFYANSAFDDQQEITVDWDRIPLSSVLSGLLKDKKLHWNEREKIVVLCPDSLIVE